MKKSFIYFAALALTVASAALTSCNNNWEYPPMVLPEATIKANTTIADLKTDFFQPGVYNYSTEVGTKADGSHYVIEGYVTSSDQSGNIFKKVYIEDETGGIYIGIDAYDLYESYKEGQKVVIDVTGLAIGGYGGAMNIGTLNATGAPNRIASDVIDNFVQVDGLPGEATKVEPMELDLNDLPASPLTLEGLAFQNTLVRINGVTFDNAGKQTLSTSGSSGVSQSFGTSTRKIVLYTSGYSDFWDYYCPTGTGDVIGILSFYGTTWQLVLNDIDGLVGFDELTKQPGPGNTPDVPEVEEGNGTADAPYSVTQAISLITSGSYPSTEVYVAGYITQITELSTSYGNATYIIGDAGSTTGLTVYRGYYIDGAKFTSEDQLEVGGKVVVKGTLTYYNNTTPEISTGSSIVSYTTPDGNTITGGDTGGEDNPGGDGGEADGVGSQDNPYNVAAVIGGATGTDVWVKGYIVGWVEGQVLADGAHFNATDVSVATNILISDKANATSLSDAVPVQLPAGDVRTALNLQNNPGNLGKQVLLKGNLEKYFGSAGVKSVTQYVFVGQE